MPNSPWFPNQRHTSEAELQLFCFPFAGSGASAYYPWRREFPAWVDVWSIEYPGRETRYREAPIECASQLADAISEEIASCIQRPFAFFGHSMGALLAFEVTRRLRNNYQLQPLELFVSGHSAPQLPPFRPPVRNLPEGKFRDELRRFGGTPEQVLADEELMSFFSPILRKDLTVLETYSYLALPPLDIPLTAFGGISDRTVPWHRLHDWSAQTTVRSSIVFLPGDHFFIREPTVGFPALMRSQLERLIGRNRVETPLKHDETVIWRVDLDRNADDVLALQRLLAADEIKRADACESHLERTQFVVLRAALRSILGERTGYSPELIEFDATRQEKLIWRDKPAGCELQFNLARSGNLALIAITQGQAVGIGIERVRPIVNIENLIEHVFSVSEQREISKALDERRLEMFFDLWVRREARAKCMGRQIVGPPEEVDFDDHASAFPRNGTGESDQTEMMLPFVQGFNPRLGYCAAVATARKCERLICFDWQPFTCESGLVGR